MKILSQTFIIAGSFILIYLADTTQLADYRIQLSIFLVLCYILITYLRRKNFQKKSNFGGSSDIFILNTILLLFIILTGRLYSPFFFLLYFLCFGITFIFEPIIVFLFVTGTILTLLPEALKNYALESFVKLGSLILIAPLAYYFGIEFKKKTKEDKIIQSSKQINSDINQIINQEKKLSQFEKEKFSDILEQSKKLQKF